MYFKVFVHLRMQKNETKKRVKLVPVTDDRNKVTVIDNVTIIEVNKYSSHK